MTGVLWIPSSVLHPVRKTPLFFGGDLGDDDNGPIDQTQD